jgi:hypothetical protein
VTGNGAVSKLALPGWPIYGEEEIGAVEAVLRRGAGNYWAGRLGESFEREFAAYCGAKYGIAVANGTVALELALRAIGVGSGDDVIVTPRSFVASASCAVNVGARPIFADVDLDSQNLTAETIAAVLTRATKAVIVVHLAGWPCDMPAILQLAQRRGLRVIEDCAQAHGASVAGRRVGAFGDAATFSFCQDKIISTGGEGGILLTSGASIDEFARSYRDHGKTLGDERNVAPDRAFRWLHDRFGTNWRLTEMQSAIGLVQLRRLEHWLARRRANAQLLVERLSSNDLLRIPRPAAGIGHANYKFYAFVRPEHFREGWNRDRLIDAIRERGIPCMQGSCGEIYRERAFRNAGLAPAQRLPNAALLGDTSIMLPVHPTLEEAHVNYMADVVDQVCRKASK